MRTGLKGFIAGMMLIGGLLVWLVFQQAGWADIVAAPATPALLSATPTATLTATPTPRPTLTPYPTMTPWPTRTPTPRPLHIFTPTPTPTPENERWISVDLQKQRLYAYEGTKLVRTFVISSGRREHPTVTGRFAIYLKLRYDDMQGADYYIANVPYVMYFYQGYGIHGAPWNKKLGTPQSHGCINMSVKDAAWLYEWAMLHTTVIVHDGY